VIFDHPDEIGSATTATDCTGKTVQERLYYPFGEFWNGAGSLGMHQTFAQLPDYDPETDQYNTPNRHYTPMGRVRRKHQGRRSGLLIGNASPPPPASSLPQMPLAWAEAFPIKASDSSVLIGASIK
jgi:hypothetical protein